MIGFLRIVGLVNAAVWFGAAIFVTFFAGPAFFSDRMIHALADQRYYAGAAAQVFLGRYFILHYVCSALAVAHLTAEWLYLGKYPQKLQVGLLIGLAAALLIGGGWLQPKMKVLHATKYGLKNRPEIRAAADHSFRAWHGVSQVINLLMVGGLTVYLWRATNPSDPTRFVSATKFAMR